MTKTDYKILLSKLAKMQKEIENSIAMVEARPVKRYYINAKNKGHVLARLEDRRKIVEKMISLVPSYPMPILPDAPKYPIKKLSLPLASLLTLLH